MSAFLAVTVGAWLLAKRSAEQQAALEDETARKERMLSPIKDFTPQKPNVQQMAALASSGIHPFRDTSARSTASDEETSTSGGLSFRRGATA